MKKAFISILACVLALLPAGCGSAGAGSQPASAAETVSTQSGGTGGHKLKVYTSFYVMYDFAKKVGGDKIDAVNLVPAGTEPHDWEPSTTDIVNLEKADVLVYNGAGMESWVDRVRSSLQNKKLAVVEASKGLDLLDGTLEDGGRAGKYDPHVWLDPKNAKAELAVIKTTLEKADSQNKSAYEDNYRKYAQLFDELDKEYASTLAKLPNKSIVVSHQAFGYLCRAYGLKQVAIEGLSADSEPDPRRMTEIIQFVKTNHIKYILFEDMVSPKVAQTIASQAGAQTLRFNPLEGLTEEEQAKGKEYVSVMKDNLKVLQTALQ